MFPPNLDFWTHLFVLCSLDQSWNCWGCPNDVGVLSYLYSSCVRKRGLQWLWRPAHLKLLNFVVVQKWLRVWTSFWNAGQPQPRLTFIPNSGARPEPGLHYNRLKHPKLHLLWGLSDMFFGYNFPKLERMCLDEIWNISDGLRCTLTQEKWGKSPQGFPSRMPKRVLFLLLSRQRGLSATYPAPVSTIFEIADVNRFAHVYTGEKFPNFCTGGFPRPKTAQNMVL